jgi:hypothetical protein
MRVKFSVRIATLGAPVNAGSEKTLLPEEDFISEHCPQQFWSWISDGYLYGHKKEYRYGDGREDYKGIN